MGNCCSARSTPSSAKSFKQHNFSDNTGHKHAPQRLSNASTCFRGSISSELPTGLLTVLLGDPLVGDDLYASYCLGDELGRGEYGVTRRCTDLATGEIYACKSISKHKLRTRVDVEDIRREVEIMRNLPPHPNIVQLKDVFEDREDVHIVMEICEGGELFEQIVTRGHYTERAAADVLRTIMEVVQHCHKNGVIHRDLKPENFLFANRSENSPLKAIDFGLSACFQQGERFSDIVGSPYYMAPELLKRNYGPEVDIWSAGVILYILLCGVPPFWSDTDEGIAKAIVQSSINLEKEPWPGISESAKDLVSCMLDPNPHTRLTTQQVIDHPWLQKNSTIPNTLLGDVVGTKLKQFSVMNRFKKKALLVVAENLPEKELDSIKQIFLMIDTNNNGNLTIDEVKKGLWLIGPQGLDVDVETLMEAADMDGNGKIDFEEFVTVTLHLKRIRSEDLLPKAFKFFDKNQSGYIEVEELREALGGDLDANEQVILDIISAVDKDQDGRISYEEFEIMMKSGTDWRNASRQYSRARFKTLSHKMFKLEGSFRKAESKRFVQKRSLKDLHHNRPELLSFLNGN